MELQEKFLHHIWDQRHLKLELKTISGKVVKVIYQGQYNTGNGPDFKNVILDLAGETLKGDVEIHYKTYDWSSHQHHEDPAFNNTILHVVFEHKSNLDFTIREDAGKVEILELKCQIDNDIEKLFHDYAANQVKSNCGICDFFTLNSNEQLSILLQNYGWERFVRKCERFNAELHFDGFDQLLYNGFMEAMGYAKNKFNMLSIAHHFKWDKLVQWRGDGLNEFSLTAIWLHYSGLTDNNGRYMKSDEYRFYLKIMDDQRFSSDKGKLSWNLFRIRPANHPVRRIPQAAKVLVPLLDTGFLKSILEVIENSRNENPNKLIARIGDVFKPDNSQFSTGNNIGRTQILTTIGNVFLPILFLYAEKTHNKELQNRLKSLYFSFPAFENNNIIKFMQGYLDDIQKKLFNVKYISQQGLMNMYFKFCNFRLCELCKDQKDMLINKL
jgi:hypothetical protein